ncbi:Putative nickel-responsive regulator [Candidatus Bilamarchaeum dharawalense]|uniref:Nickel-responsive regulator n=1 Tax=Candidatus Bilamarchaeum dharawalense TaxID=2885759 RepID=A0A5E4LTI5_9ARCH|nr:Putative nickel-responsive regulator [Candidatus Bilamarchaeum dharawalense]
MSLDNETLKELDRVQQTLGFKSRSKLLRTTLQSLINEYRIMESLKGHVDSVFVVTYKESEKHSISDLLHNFEDTIKTVIHQHHVGVCLEVLIICADAKRIRELFSILKKHKGVRSVSCSVI